MKPAPFTPDPRLAGKSLIECQCIIGGQKPGAGKSTEITALWHRQGGRCFYCDRPMVQVRRRAGESALPHSVTIDHILTRSHGGRAGPKVAACFECNMLRGDLPAHDFLLVMVARDRLGVLT